MSKYSKLAAATLARGYTRACDYIFDSDDDATLASGYAPWACDYLFESGDDTPVPLLHIAIPSRLNHSLPVASAHLPGCG